MTDGTTGTLEAIALPQGMGHVLVKWRSHPQGIGGTARVGGPPTQKDVAADGRVGVAEATAPTTRHGAAGALGRRMMLAPAAHPHEIGGIARAGGPPVGKSAMASGSTGVAMAETLTLKTRWTMTAKTRGTTATKKGSLKEAQGGHPRGGAPARELEHGGDLGLARGRLGESEPVSASVGRGGL